MSSARCQPKPEKLETGSSQNGDNNKVKGIINDAKGGAKGTPRGAAPRRRSKANRITS